jgi:hypothetical protein
MTQKLDAGIPLNSNKMILIIMHLKFSRNRRLSIRLFRRNVPEYEIYGINVEGAQAVCMIRIYR